MDTRFWGPSGWRLLHMISFAVETPAGPKEGDVVAFFKLLPFVLPCKYCRCNLVGHMEKEPLGRSSLSKWLWAIHNHANAVTASASAAPANPPFAKVRQVYEDRLAAGCSRTVFEGWEFLFSIAEAHPMSSTSRNSLPLEGAPATAADPLERARWNLMSPEERLPYYEQFFRLLPKVLPFPEWRRIAATAIGPHSDWSTRTSTLKTLWSLRSTMEKELELLNKTTYSDLCKVLRHYRSGCSTAARGKTCRRKRGSTR